MTEYFSEDAIWTFFSSYAYEPMIIYSAVVVIMFASSFGLPVPEEVTLISSGLIAYMAMNPDQYPPPTPDAEGVNVYVLATVCFVAVLFSDVVIYLLGRFFWKEDHSNQFFQTHNWYRKVRKN
jgi:membrane protein DedA with SNARE-associated domain